MALEPQKQPDIFLIRGDSYSLNFTVTGVDLTGSTVFFTVKEILDQDDAADAAAVIAVEVTDHSDPTNGVTVIPLTGTDTDVDPGLYYYDIQIKNGSTITSIPARKLRIWADVTRRTS